MHHFFTGGYKTDFLQLCIFLKRKDLKKDLKMSENEKEKNEREVSYETVIEFLTEYENQPQLTPYQERLEYLKPTKKLIKSWLLPQYMLLLETTYIEQVRKNPPKIQTLKNTTYVYSLNKGIEYPNLCSIYKDIEF